MKLDLEYFDKLLEVRDKPEGHVGEWSGLVWKQERRSGRNNCIINASVGDMAGCLKVNKKSGRGHWEVVSDRRNYLAHRIIWLLLNKNIDDNLQIDHVNGNALDNSIQNLRLVSSATNSRNCKKYNTNKTGVVGVCWDVSKVGYKYAVAQWRDLNGKIQAKTFSATKLGEQEAFEAACIYRKQMIDNLNQQFGDDGYTTRHGKDKNA